MKIQQKKFTNAEDWEIIKGSKFNPEAANLLTVFGSSDLVSQKDLYKNLRKEYPNAEILINSTAGEIINTEVNDNTVSLTAIEFEKSGVKSASVHIKDYKDSYEAGRNLAGKIDPLNLQFALVISDGHMVNGSELVIGLQERLPENTILTGGLAGDGSRFERTYVGLNETPVEGRIAIAALYGDALSVTYGCAGGWDPFGPERLITKSDKNILFELDGKPALDIYKMYLGEYADELPGSGLLFPLSIRRNSPELPLVRTILSINEKEKSLTFAGNMPEGSYARLMKANLDRLIDGSSNAANNCMFGLKDMPDLAILISCVGRKLVLDRRVEEEVEVIRALFGERTAITGFYSYGEISPIFNFNKCELHNQTMTITTITERP